MSEYLCASVCVCVCVCVCGLVRTGTSGDNFVFLIT